MWRYREHFVDVVAFRCARGGGGLTFSFGCAFRFGVRLHPAPVHCEFEPFDLELARTDRFRPHIEFALDLRAQREALEVLAPAVVEEATRWFAQFETPETALHVVETAPEGVLRGAPRGSPKQVAILRRLRDLAPAH